MYARCNGKNIIHMFAHYAATLQRAGRFSERHGKPEERVWIIQHVCFKSCVFLCVLTPDKYDGKLLQTVKIG